MKILDNIKSEDIISLDIESCRVEEHFENLSEGYREAWAYKNKQDGKIPTEQELSDLWERTSSLYPEFSKICAISLSFLHSGKLYCKEFYGPNEKKLLEMVSVTLQNIVVKGSNEKIKYRLLGHASKYFDYPFMAKRYVINGMQLPDILDVTMMKPWEQTNLCSNELWKMGGTGPGSSLQALCNVLDIPISKVDLVGDEVAQVYFQGGYARIGRYCSYDTVATFNVFRRFKKEAIFQFDEVEYKSYSTEDETPVEKAEKLPLLQRIFNNKNITNEDRTEVLALLKKRKLPKKDKEVIMEIIRSSLCALNPDFGSISNSKQVDEVIELLKQDL